MKAVYVKTKWIDNKTPVNAANLNKIEDAISTLYNNCLSYSEIREGKGITVTVTKDKEVEISVSPEVVTSDNITGIEYLFDDGCDCGCVGAKKGVLYLTLDKESKKLKYISLNGVKIFEVK